MDRPLRIGAVSAASPRDVDASLDQILGAVAEARQGELDLLVLPESALGGYILEHGDGRPSEPPVALRRDGPELARIAEAAGPMVVCVGYVEDAPGGPYAAVAAVCDGAILGHHRKVHVPPAERGLLNAGDEFVAFETPFGRMGMLLCYDKLFPEAARALALDGAEVIACPAAWCRDRHETVDRIEDDRQVLHFDALDVVRAVENQVVWVSTNQVGRLGHLDFFGHSKIVDPHGRILSSTGHEAGLAGVDVAVADVRRDARRHIDHIADRRPDVYAAAGVA